MLKKIINQSIIAASRLQAYALKAKVKINPRWDSSVSRSIKQNDKTFSDSFDSVYKLFESLGARYVDSYASPGTSILVLPANNLFTLLNQLSFIETNGIYPITFKVYGDKVIRKDFYSLISFAKVRILSDILNKKPSFYLQILHQDHKGVLSNIFSKEIHLLFSKNDGIYSVKASNHISCQKVHETDIDNVFSTLKCNDGQSYSDSHHHVFKNPVDVVITWVDKGDTNWQNLWNDTFGSDVSAQEPDSDRFSCSNEILYCLRSIHTHLNWINKIHIISNCEPPAWLNTNHPRINWVDHTDIIDEKYLPTFNSHAIESSLHRVSGLSEHYLYFNDDFIVTKPTHVSHFFDPFMRPLMNCENYAIVRPSYLNVIDKDYMVASVNSYNLLCQLDIKLPDALNLHCHVPYAFSKQLVEQFEADAAHSFHLTRSAKIRSNTDINIASFCCHWYGLAKGQVVKNPLIVNNDYSIVRPSNLESLMNSTVLPRFLCFNDGDQTSSMKSYKYTCDLFLQKIFPCKSFAEV